jgi:hypothetical protein
MAVKTNYTRGQRPTPAEANAFAANPALQYITQVNINAVTTNVTSVFGFTYDNYHLEWSGLYSSTGASFALLTMTGGTGTAHYDGVRDTNSAGAVGLNGQNGTGYWVGIPASGSLANSNQASMDILSPYLSANTLYMARFSNALGGGFCGGQHASNTSYTGFSIVGLFGSNIVGTLRIYGYRKP